MGCYVVLLKFKAAWATDDALKIIKTREKCMDSDKNHSFCLVTCIVLFVIPEKLIFKSSLEKFNKRLQRTRDSQRANGISQVYEETRKYSTKFENKNRHVKRHPQ